VRSQYDIEAADIKREREELLDDPVGELRELQEIYVTRGLTRELAKEVALQLTAKDALAAHARDELGITDMSAAKPMQAALTSAASFSVGAFIPLVVVLMLSSQYLQLGMASVSLSALVILGGLAARAGGANVLVGALRVGFWGAAAMALTSLVGHMLGVSV
jgi:vacuolar iron transporter family protein